jgi:putative oxidoreductase
MMETPRDLLSSVGLLILRLGMGGFMATHGWGKVQMLRAGDFAGFGDPIGIGPAPSLILATAAEFGCALLVALGLGTRFAALPVAFTMGVAAFVAHATDPWTSGKGAELFFSGQSKMWSSKEPALVYLFGFLSLVFTGGGRFALDALIGRKRRGRR